MTNLATDLLKKLIVTFSETLSSFRRNNDLSAASSLAFSATVALIPSLFLLTLVLGAVIGSSGHALARTQALLMEVIPAYSQDILREVRLIASHVSTIGVLNMLVLLWSITPLVADLRTSLGAIFRKRPTHPFLLEKLFDMAISVVFLLGVSAIAVAGVVFLWLEKKSQLHPSLGPFESVVPFFFVTAIVFSLYFAFSKRLHPAHLLAGALATSLMWFALRPVFHLFLLYNPGYGFAFGSFKSLFVVIIWIYCSFVVFLLGAELASSLKRHETIFLKHLMEGRKRVPIDIVGKYVMSYEKGAMIFSEGDAGDKMFSVLIGSVMIRKGEKEVAIITPGKCFGGLSFLLSTPRVASAIAREYVELVTVSNENINELMDEYPEFVIEILREMAQRLRESNKVVD